MSGSMSFDNLSSLMSTSTSFSSDLNLNSELNPARGRSSTNTTGSSQAQGIQISFLTEQAWSHGGLRTRELGQDPSHVSMGD